MTFSTDIQGDELLIKGLTAPMQPAIEAGAQGIAAEAMDRTMPYPREPRRKPNAPYYVRGTGLFTSFGVLIKRSETLNRRWNVRPLAFGAALENNASYAARVKGNRQQQTRHHGRTGWTRTIEDVQSVVDDGTAAEIMGAAITNVIRKGKS